MRAAARLAGVMLIAGWIGAVGTRRRFGVAGYGQILLLGDSVTQGSAGDWTWRYRLGGTSPAVPVDFVGPAAGPVGPPPTGPARPTTPSPRFDKDHAVDAGG